MTAYDGASRTKRTGGWAASSNGPNRALNSALPILRNRSRAAYRNNPLIKKALSSLVSNTIGTGIRPRYRTSDDEQIQIQIREQWKHHQAGIDADGNAEFYGLQAQIDLAARLSGEVFILRISEASSQITIPLQIQLLESEFVPADMSMKLPSGNEIRAGIEFSGRTRVAYHIYTEHPQEEGSWLNKTIRIPAEDIIHFYKPSRPGQLRGEPDASQSLLKAYTFDAYDDAELLRKQTRAPFTGAIEQNFDDSNVEGKQYKYNPNTGDPIGEGDPYEPPVLDVSGGSFIGLLPGESLKMFDGDKSGDGYKDFMRMQMMLIAAGFKLPYELMTGDWEKVNERLVRALLNEFYRMLRAEQSHFIHSVCRRVWGWWLDAGVVSGVITIPNYMEQRNQLIGVRWVADRWAYINPVQDVTASAKEIDAGLESRDEKIFQRGRIPSEVDEEQAEGNSRRQAHTSEGDEDE